MKVKTIIQDNERFHVIAGQMVQCSGSRDCAHCQQDQINHIESWVKLHNPICILCDEKPPCYICLKHKCKEWCKDKQYIEEVGSYHGCYNSIQRAYCQDFICKHGFIGWWMNGWQDAFEERSKTIEKELLSKLRKKETTDEPKTKAKKTTKPNRKPTT